MALVDTDRRCPLPDVMAVWWCGSANKTTSESPVCTVLECKRGDFVRSGGQSKGEGEGRGTKQEAEGRTRLLVSCVDCLTVGLARAPVTN